MFSLLLILMIGCAALIVANLVSQARPPVDTGRRSTLA